MTVIPTEYIFTIASKTTGVDDAARKLQSMEEHIRRVTGKDFKITGFTKMQQDVNGVTQSMVQLTDATSKARMAVGMTTTGYTYQKYANLSGGGRFREVGADGVKGKIIGKPSGFDQLSPEKQNAIKAGLVQYTNAIDKSSLAMKGMERAADGANKSQAALAARALTVIPIWMAFRWTYQAVIGSVKEMIQRHVELEEGMRRVMAVSRDFGSDQTETYNRLNQAAHAYFQTSASSMKDITESMYQLGTAGLSTTQVLEGFEHILNLSVGAFVDVRTAGRTVAGVLNVFGDEMARFGSEAAKVQYITDVLAHSWQNNQIEISEIATAMSYLGSVGQLLDISFEELIATQEVLNNSMLKGGKGARVMARALTRVATNAGKLKGLGIEIDETQPLNYINLMEQLNALYGDQAGSLMKLASLNDVFGVQGTRAIGLILPKMDELKNKVGDTRNVVTGLAKALKESSEVTIGKEWTQYWRNLTSGGHDIGARGGFIGAITEHFHKQNEAVALQINLVKDLARIYDIAGSKLKIMPKLLGDMVLGLQGVGATNMALKLLESQ